MNFQGEQSDYQVLQRKVYSAMETGNHAAARLLVKEHEETFDLEVKLIRRQVMNDYGIRI